MLPSAMMPISDQTGVIGEFDALDVVFEFGDGGFNLKFCWKGNVMQ